MSPSENATYILAPGTQVRNEDFGLLFYTMKGPRLYFLSSGPWLDAAFFHGEQTLDEWLRMENRGDMIPRDRAEKIMENLDRLKKKGVVIER